MRNLSFCLTASTFHAEGSLKMESDIANQLWQKNMLVVCEEAASEFQSFFCSSFPPPNL